MSSPLKLALITLGCASVFAAAPYLVAELAPLQSSNDPAIGASSPARQAPRVIASPVATKAGTPAPPPPPVVAKAPQATRTSAPTVVAKATAAAPSVKPTAKKEVAAATRAPAVVASVPSPPIVQVAKPTPAPTATPKPEIVFQPEVAHAQQAMNKLGLHPETADGKLGTRTQVALKDFQKKNNLPESGQADKATIAKLDSAVAQAVVVEAARLTAAKRAKDAEIAAAAAIAAAKPAVPAASLAPLQQPVLAKADLKVPSVPRMTKVPEVRRIQQALIAANCYSGDADGKWGHLTIVGLKSFQERSALKVTGKMDKTTWAKLYAAQQNAGSAPPNAVVASAPVTKTAAGPTELKISSAASKPETTAPAPSSAAAPAKLVSGSVGTREGSVAPGIIAEAKTAVGSAVPAKTGSTTDSQKPTVEAAPATTTAAVTGPQPGEVLAISSATAADTTPKQNVIVKVDNSDGNPGERPLIETPTTISREARDASAAAASAEGGGQARNEALERDLAAARERDAARTGSLNVAGEAVKVIGAADKVSDRLESPVKTRNVSTSRATSAKTNPKAEAQAKVQEVEQTYKTVKTRWADQVRKGTLADTMSKIDTGYEAMKTDFKKGNYDPILKLGDGFKLRITMLSDEAAANYVEDQMANKTVRAKISTEQAQEIEKLKKDKKFTQAADIVAACAKKPTPKVSEGTSTKSKKSSVKSSDEDTESAKDSDAKPSGNSKKVTEGKSRKSRDAENEDETADKKQDNSEKKKPASTEKTPAETSKKKSVSKTSDKSDEKPATKTASKSKRTTSRTSTSKKKGSSGTTSKKSTKKDTSSDEEKPASKKKTSTSKSTPRESTDE